MNKMLQKLQDVVWRPYGVSPTEPIQGWVGITVDIGIISVVKLEAIELIFINIC